MSIRSFTATDFRCLAQVALEPHPDSNLIVGPNASGKTSLLEAIYFLGRGRSFRVARSRELIRDKARALVVRATFDRAPASLAVRASNAGLEIRVDGEPARGASHLAAALPVQVIEPGIHRLIESGPAQRRAFLDWGVFHVKHSFLEEWRRYQRALRQRGAALRAGPQRAAARAWEDALIAAGEAVDQLRRMYLDALTPWVTAVGERLLGQAVALSYHRGWSADLPLREALESSWERDARLAVTHCGPHRADLVLRLADRAARHRVSRGQQKLLAAGLVLAQMHLFHAERADHAVLLIDDPAAELDRDSQRRLFEVVADVPAQRFLAGLDSGELPQHEAHRMFHVEQGKIEKVL